jgi:hypothetical protein
VSGAVSEAEDVSQAMALSSRPAVILCRVWGEGQNNRPQHLHLDFQHRDGTAVSHRAAWMMNSLTRPEIWSSAPRKGGNKDARLYQVDARSTRLLPLDWLPANGLSALCWAEVFYPPSRSPCKST